MQKGPIGIPRPMVTSTLLKDDPSPMDAVTQNRPFWRGVHVVSTRLLTGNALIAPNEANPVDWKKTWSPLSVVAVSL